MLNRVCQPWKQKPPKVTDLRGQGKSSLPHRAWNNKPEGISNAFGAGSRHARRAMRTPPAPIPTIRSAPDFHRCPASAQWASARGLRR